MRIIASADISAAVAAACMQSNYELPADMERALHDAAAREESPQGKAIFTQLIENLSIARAEQMPVCQDTGLVAVFAELGTGCAIDGDIYAAINEGVRAGYRDGYLRKSVVGDPFRRNNTGDNTPAVIHLTLAPGDKLKLVIVPKGGGCENVSTVRMMKPADDIEGAHSFLLDFINERGSNACPPLVIGVGIGGNFESCALMAKHALATREIGSTHSDPFYAELERAWLDDVNKTGIGPMGLGGRITALGLFIETAPCHIASLPVAINVNCHAARHKTIII